MGDNLSALIGQAQAGDFLAFSRVLTQIETRGSEVLATPELLKPAHVALRVGITGPPGAGKSTLIGRLLLEFLKTKKRVGVIAVDPTSPHSSGAILGDRIRYGDVAMDPRVFMRSLGTRGSLGGLSASVYLMLRAFDACGFDLVLIETVGVGQVEVEVMNVADVVALLLVPESGDSIQAMKAGILEIADVVIVNKSDRPGAEAIRREIENELGSDQSNFRGEVRKGIQVIPCVATEGAGAQNVATSILKLADLRPLERQSAKRLQAEARALSRVKMEARANASFQSIASPEDLRDALGKF